MKATWERGHIRALVRDHDWEMVTPQYLVAMIEIMLASHPEIPARVATERARNIAAGLVKTIVTSG